MASIPSSVHTTATTAYSQRMLISSSFHNVFSAIDRTPNHALQRTRWERRGGNPCVPWAGSLSSLDVIRHIHEKSYFFDSASCQRLVAPWVDRFGICSDG